MTRSRLFILLAAALALAWLAGPARAQDHAEPAAHGEPAHAAGHEAVGVMPTIKQGLVVATASIVVFGIVFGVLATTVWPKIVKGLNDREAKIREEIESAERARQQAKDALAQYEKSLAEARSEAQKMLEATKAQQQALAAELKAKADVELTAMKERARRDIESAKRAAISEIYAEATSLATKIAGKILQREVKPSDQQRLVEESVRELQTARG